MLYEFASSLLRGLLLTLVVVGAACSAPPSSTPDTAPATLPSNTLQLLPPTTAPADPETIRILTAWRWVYSGASNILGDGQDTILDFDLTPEKGLTVTRTYRKFKGFQQSVTKPSAESVEGTHACSLHGPVISFADHQQTFAIVPQEKASSPQLILNAVVPLGQRRWYCAMSSEGDMPRTSELLFEFADDPQINERGTGTVQFRNADEAPVSQIVQFDVPNIGGERTVRVQPHISAGASFEWAYLNFFPNHARINDQNHINSQTYMAVKKGN